MALIKCPECGWEISDKAESCPICGCPMQSQLKPNCGEGISSRSKINGVEFDILEIQDKLYSPTVENVVNKIKTLCNCFQEDAEIVVYRYFLHTHGDFIGNIEELKRKIEHIKSTKRNNAYCPYCLSRKIGTTESISESVIKGKSEMRKKSAITRAGNTAGRAAMIGMTGGLWALTPKKSKYNEVSKGKTEYHTKIVKICMDCGKHIS